MVLDLVVDMVLGFLLLFALFLALPVVLGVFVACSTLDLERILDILLVVGSGDEPREERLCFFLKWTTTRLERKIRRPVREDRTCCA